MCDSLRVIFLNDASGLNIRYRSSLMSRFELQGYTVQSLGLRDSVPSFVSLILSSYLHSDVIISSNMRSNLVSLAFCKRNTINIILNGFGRLRGQRWARIAIATLLMSRARSVAVQNYADFRYLRRYYLSDVRLHWICGSGGNSRDTGQSKGRFSVSRDSKLLACSKSIAEYFKDAGDASSVCIVGCKELPSSLHGVNYNLVPVGFVDQADILKFGDELVIFGGYGDGFPHVAADALVSHIPLVLQLSEYIRFGLRKIGANATPIKGRWVTVNPNERLTRELNCDEVSRRYYDFFVSQMES